MVVAVALGLVLAILAGSALMLIPVGADWSRQLFVFERSQGRWAVVAVAAAVTVLVASLAGLGSRLADSFFVTVVALLVVLLVLATAWAWARSRSPQ